MAGTRVLIVDDEVNARESLVAAPRRRGRALRLRPGRA